MALGVTERSGIRDTSRAILVVGNHVRLAVIQTTFTVAAVPLERSADAKDRRDPTSHRGQAAARSQGPPEGPLASSSLAELGLSKMAPPRSLARPCQGMEAFQMLQRLQTVGWSASANMGPSQEVSR